MHHSADQPDMSLTLRRPYVAGRYARYIEQPELVNQQHHMAILRALADEQFEFAGEFGEPAMLWDEANGAAVSLATMIEDGDAIKIKARLQSLLQILDNGQRADRAQRQGLLYLEHLTKTAKTQADVFKVFGGVPTIEQLNQWVQDVGAAVMEIVLDAPEVPNAKRSALAQRVILGVMARAESLTSAKHASGAHAALPSKS